MHKAMVLGTLAALGMAAQAQADDNFSYSYLEGAYVREHIDGLSGHPDGFGVQGSVALAPMVHGIAGYEDLSIHGISLKTWKVGLGLNHSVSSNIDLIGRASYLRGKIEDLGHDDGYLLEAGLRGRVMENFELEGFLNRSDLDALGKNSSITANARYFFAPQFAVGAGFTYDDDATVWNVGVRWNFK